MARSTPLSRESPWHRERSLNTARFPPTADPTATLVGGGRWGCILHSVPDFRPSPYRSMPSRY